MRPLWTRGVLVSVLLLCPGSSPAITTPIHYNSDGGGDLPAEAKPADVMSRSKELRKRNREFNDRIRGVDFKDMSPEDQKTYLQLLEDNIRFADWATPKVEGWTDPDFKTAQTLTLGFLKTLRQTAVDRRQAALASTKPPPGPTAAPTNAETTTTGGSRPPGKPEPTPAAGPPAEDPNLDGLERELSRVVPPETPGADGGRLPEDAADRSRQFGAASGRVGSSAKRMAEGLQGGSLEDDGIAGGPQEAEREKSAGSRGPEQADGRTAPAPNLTDPQTTRDLALASFGGYGEVFRRLGLKAGPAGISRADGTPASPMELDRLRREIRSEPAALMTRPDFFAALPREHFSQFKQAYQEDPGRPDGAFKHIRLTAEDRDAEWSKSCAAVSGDCNKYSKENSYKKDDFVSPETLENIWAQALREVKEEEAARRERRQQPDSLKGRLGRAWDRISSLLGAAPGDRAGIALDDGAQVPEAGSEAGGQSRSTDRGAPHGASRAGGSPGNASSRMNGTPAARPWRWLLYVAGGALLVIGLVLRRR